MFDDGTYGVAEVPVCETAFVELLVPTDDSTVVEEIVLAPGGRVIGAPTASHRCTISSNAAFPAGCCETTQ